MPVRQLRERTAALRAENMRLIERLRDLDRQIAALEAEKEASDKGKDIIRL